MAYHLRRHMEPLFVEHGVDLALWGQYAPEPCHCTIPSVSLLLSLLFLLLLASFWSLFLPLPSPSPSPLLLLLLLLLCTFCCCE